MKKPWTLLTALAVALTLTVTPALAQDRPATENAQPTTRQGAQPARDEPASGPSGSPLTSGDTKPSAVDPAEASKTGANAGEGASYSRSNDKGESAMPKQDTEKK